MCSNLRLLEEAGADLVFFSPVEDCLPANLAGLYLGGGYPEKYAQELSGNKMLLTAVKAFAEAGGVVYAECGGLIYLSQSIQPLQEQPVGLGETINNRTCFCFRGGKRHLFHSSLTSFNLSVPLL